jgi:hypothetical protein
MADFIEAVKHNPGARMATVMFILALVPFVGILIATL